MPFVTHKNGQTTHYLDDDFVDPWQPHDTILIQHGFARHARFWYKWVPVLAKHYRVIRRDARGHGLSSAPGKDYEYEVDTILDEIVDTMDQLGIEKVHYLGESTGGIFGEFLAVRHPERLHSLAICASPLYMPVSAQKALAFGYSDWPEACRQLGSRGWSEAMAHVAGTDQALDKNFFRWWLDQVGVATGEALADHAALLCKETFDARRVMGQIKVPMLSLSPANSQLVNLDDQHALHKAVKGSQLEVVAGFGHEIYLDQAELCQAKYLSFLRQIEAHTVS